MRDIDVEIRGDSLSGKRILFGISGGIAAVDSVRCVRELRRHGAEVTVCMTDSAQRIITPLALKWATGKQPITNWEGEMSQLSDFDGVLVSPATRNLLSSHLNGLMSSPLLMALSAARGRKVPMLLIPSMHADLFDELITTEIVSKLRKQGAIIQWSEGEEGKIKTLDHRQIVADLAHHINSQRPARKSAVITLGATQSSIDDVRFIQNTSSGKTGWGIAVDLYRNGHDVTVVCGSTSKIPEISLPLVIVAEDPNLMLLELKTLAKDQIDAWVHCAAVLDYVVGNPIEGKIASLQTGLNLQLVQGEKHIRELSTLTNGATRVGFKLECGIKIHDLVHRALALIENSQLTAVIANRLEDIDDESKPRAHLVDATGEHWALQDHSDLVSAVRHLVEN